MSDFDVSMRLKLIDQISSGAHRVENALKDVNRAANNLNGGARRNSQLSSNLKRMSGEAGFLRTAVSSAAGKVDRLNLGLEGSILGVSRLGSIAGVAAGAATIGFLVKAEREARKFEESLADVATAMNNKSPEGLQTIADTVRGLAKQTGIAKELLLEMTADAMRANVKEEDAPRFAAIGAKSSVAFRMSPEEMAAALTPVLLNFKLDLDGLQRGTDIINTAADASGGKATERNILNFLGRTTRDYRIGLDQWSAIGATFLGGGKEPEIAATATNAILARLANPDRNTSDGLNALGLSSKRVGAGMDKDPYATLVDVVERVAKVKSPTKRAGILKDIGGGNFGDDLSGLVNNIDALKGTLEAIRNPKNQGSVDRVFATMMSTTEAAYARLGRAFDDLTGKIGEKLLPFLERFAEGLASLLNTISGWLGDEREDRVRNKLADNQPLNNADKVFLANDPSVKLRVEDEAAVQRSDRVEDLKRQLEAFTRQQEAMRAAGRLTSDNEISIKARLEAMRGELERLQGPAAEAGRAAGSSYRSNLADELAKAAVDAAIFAARIHSALEINAYPTISPRLDASPPVAPSPSAPPVLKQQSSVGRRGNVTIINHINVASGDAAAKAVGKSLAASLRRSTEGAFHDGVA